MTLVLGVDSSTQSCKALLVDAETGAVVDQAQAPHPDGTEVDPEAWWDALRNTTADLLPRAAAVGIGGQQHGLVALDGNDLVVRPALLWNDTRSAAAARELVVEFGGPDAWAEAVGSVPVASFTISKLRWLADREPDSAAATRRVLLPHDWLSWRLGADEPTTDRGDASGTGYWSPFTDSYREDLIELAIRRRVATPRVAAPSEVIGTTSTGAAIAAGTGDNMAAALGLAIGPGDVVVSIGTSGTVFAVSPQPCADPSGDVAGFADATGRFLPLVCTLNAARVLSSTADALGTDLAGLDDLALQAEPGADGLTLLPYFTGERTPNLPGATGSLTGMTMRSLTPPNLARAAVEGMLCGLADGLDAIRRMGVDPQRVILIGGGARSRAVRAIAGEVFGLAVTAPAPAEYVALGAARQAAWALSGASTPPVWTRSHTEVIEVTEADVAAGAEVRRRFHGWRDQVHPPA